MSPTELRFFGSGVDGLILRNLKLVTIRKEPKGFSLNSQVMGKHQVSAHSTHSIDIPLTILREEVHPLGLVFPGILLLDGYLNPSAAVDDMRTIYNDPNLTEDILTAQILFITQEVATSIGPSGVALLAHNSQERAIQSFRLEKTVFPAYFYWLVNHHQIPEEKYPDELHNRGIITSSQLATAKDHYEKLQSASNEYDRQYHRLHFILTG